MNSLEASHAFFEPAHAVAEIPEPGIHVAAEIPEPGIHVVAEIPVLGIHVGAQIPVLGIHVDSEIRDVAAQLLDVLARDAVQVEHEANDDGRGNPLEEFSCGSSGGWTSNEGKRKRSRSVAGIDRRPG